MGGFAASDVELLEVDDLLVSLTTRFVLCC